MSFDAASVRAVTDPMIMESVGFYFKTVEHYMGQSRI